MKNAEVAGADFEPQARKNALKCTFREDDIFDSCKYTISPPNGGSRSLADAGCTPQLWRKPATVALLAGMGLTNSRERWDGKGGKAGGREREGEERERGRERGGTQASEASTRPALRSEGPLLLPPSPPSPFSPFSPALSLRFRSTHSSPTSPSLADFPLVPFFPLSPPSASRLL
eukprot:3941306-Rhodomonas_salina.1